MTTHEKTNHLPYKYNELKMEKQQNSKTYLKSSMNWKIHSFCIPQGKW